MHILLTTLLALIVQPSFAKKVAKVVECSYYDSVVRENIDFIFTFMSDTSNPIIVPDGFNPVVVLSSYVNAREAVIIKLNERTLVQTHSYDEGVTLKGGSNGLNVWLTFPTTSEVAVAQLSYFERLQKKVEAEVLCKNL